MIPIVHSVVHIWHISFTKLLCPAVFGHFSPAPYKQLGRYESNKPIKSKLTYRQSINQPKGPTMKNSPSEKLPHGDDFRVGPKSDRTPWKKTVHVSPITIRKKLTMFGYDSPMWSNQKRLLCSMQWKPTRNFWTWNKTRLFTGKPSPRIISIGRTGKRRAARYQWSKMLCTPQFYFCFLRKSFLSINFLSNFFFFFFFFWNEKNEKKFIFIFFRFFYTFLWTG